MLDVADDSWTKPTGGDEKLFARFGLYPVKDDAKSAEAGRPIFDDVEYVEIIVPGDRSNIIHRPVRADDKQRFPKQWAAWKANGTQGHSGTLLKEWPSITRGQVEELAHFGVHTVEQLAATSDANMQNIGPMLSLRQRAQDFLEKAKGNAPVEKMRAELAVRDNLIETMQRQLKEQGDALAELKKAKGK